MADKTHKNIFGDGYTTYHDDGSKSQTYKNLTNDGYTTYHDDGSTSQTYRNLTSDGFTTFHSTGDVSRSYKNLTNNGYTTYTEGNGTGINLSSIWTIPICIVMFFSLFIIKNAPFVLGLIFVSVIVRIWINKKYNTSFFGLWFYPISLLGWRLFVNNWWKYRPNGIDEAFLGLTAGIASFIILLGIVASIFIDNSENFGIFCYCALATVAMFFAKAYGEELPYKIVGGMLLIALILTPFWIMYRRKK